MTYYVHLSMKLEDETPEQAVRSMIEALVIHGLRQWTYQVDNVDAEGKPHDVVGHYSGHGILLSGSTQTTDTPGTVDEDDASLLAYAAALLDS